jgi:hypothetical protein
MLPTGLPSTHPLFPVTQQCQWEACGAELLDQKRLTAHAQTHILETIPCAYQGLPVPARMQFPTSVDLNLDCNETFRNPKELMEHNVRHKKQGTALKMSWRPTASQQLLPLPELVQDIPAWAVLAPHVWVPHISKERRETLSTWVTPPSQHISHYLDADVNDPSGTAQYLLSKNLNPPLLFMRRWWRFIIYYLLLY